MNNYIQNNEESYTEVRSFVPFNENKSEELINILNSEENKPLIYPKMPNGLVRSFCASSFLNDQEINYDKISIAVNLKVYSKDVKVNINPDKLAINFFGLFDGHNGTYTSEKLRDKYLKYLILDEDFLIRTDQSIINAFKKIDEEIKAEIIKNDVKVSISRNSDKSINTDNKMISSSENNLENSGSSALICLTINENIYVANLGTCRGILSSKIGSRIHHLTKEHSLKNESEKERIVRAGGVVYEKNSIQRIKQGDLTSCRSIGDTHAKLLQKEGKLPIYLNIPDVVHFKLTNEDDFVILLSDSIYEKVETPQLVRIIYETLFEVIENNLSIDYLYSYSIHKIFKFAIKSGATGPLTCIILFFTHLIELFINKNLDMIKEKLFYIKISNNQVDFINENLVKINFYEDQAGLISRNANDSIQMNQNQNNLIINNFSNRISITKETKIYCCCFKKKKKTKNIQNNSNINQSGSF